MEAIRSEQVPFQDHILSRIPRKPKENNNDNDQDIDVLSEETCYDEHSDDVYEFI